MFRQSTLNNSPRSHPDRIKAGYVVHGLRQGFSLMFNPESRLKPATSNCSSALVHPHIIDDYLSKEIQLGRVAGPFSTPPMPNLQISRFGVIPKSSSNAWRLILDLSYPEGYS